MMIFITEDDVFHMKEKPCIPLLKLQPLMYAVSNIGTQSTRASLFLSTVVCSTNNKMWTETRFYICTSTEHACTHELFM